MVDVIFIFMFYALPFVSLMAFLAWVYKKSKTQVTAQTESLMNNYRSSEERNKQLARIADALEQIARK